jgi:outer membrane murein-binding lipoprotein Lpp
MKRSTMVITGVITTVLLLVVACSGGDEDENPELSSITRQLQEQNAKLEQANAMLQQQQQAVQQAPQQPVIINSQPSHDSGNSFVETMGAVVAGNMIGNALSGNNNNGGGYNNQRPVVVNRTTINKVYTRPSSTFSKPRRTFKSSSSFGSRSFSSRRR